MKKISEIYNTLSSSEQLSRANLEIMGGKRNRDDKRRQRPGGGTTTTSPGRFVEAFVYSNLNDGISK